MTGNHALSLQCLHWFAVGLSQGYNKRYPTISRANHFANQKLNKKTPSGIKNHI